MMKPGEGTGEGTRREVPGTLLLRDLCWLGIIVVPAPNSEGCRKAPLRSYAPGGGRGLYVPHPRYPAPPRPTHRGELSLLHVADHVAVQNDPREKRTVDLLNLFEHIGIGNLNFHPKILLLVDEDRFGKAERGHGVRLPMGRKFCRFRERTRPRREKPGRH